jgi:site-specific recombinase XerD
VDANELTTADFRRHLRAERKSDRTIKSYLEALRLFAAHQAGADVLEASRADVENFIVDQLERHKPATAANRFRSLQQLYKWADAESLIDANPMAGLKPPSVPETPVPVVTDEHLRKLLAACAVTGRAPAARTAKWVEYFAARRDEAMIRLMLEPGGMRLAEIAGVTTEGVDVESDVVVVHGKGDRVRAIPYGVRTGQALSRYLRLRPAHKYAPLPTLWLAQKGGMTPSGVHQMLERRCALAGIPRIHAHQLRHTSADRWLAESGGDETSAMRLFGWRSRQMLQRYGASNADARAHAAARRLSLGDRL